MRRKLTCKIATIFFDYVKKDLLNDEKNYFISNFDIIFDLVYHISSCLNSSSEVSTTECIQKKIIIEESINPKIVIDKSGTGYSDMPYYSRFGNNVYVLSEDEEGNIGTKKFEFFPFTCGYLKREL